MNKQYFFLIANLIPFVAHATSLNDEEHAARIKQLQSLSLEELMEIPMVSVATGLKQSSSDAPAVTTVITDKDIQAIGATNLSEVLETVPGFHVSRNSDGYFAIYTVRGIYTGQYNPELSILVNSIPISIGYTGGHPVFSGEFPLQNVKRIEIIRGPGSAVYGADAFAGVVNIITKTAKDIDGVEIGARTGSFKSNAAWFQQSEKLGENDIALSVEIKDTDGDKSIIKEDLITQIARFYQQPPSSFAPSSVSRSEQGIDTRLDISNENWQWRNAAQLRRNLGNGVGILKTLDPIGRYVSNILSSDLTYQNKTLIKNWEFSAQMSGYYYSFEVENFLMFLPAGAYGEGSLPYLAKYGVTEMQGHLNLNAFYKGFENH